MQLHSLIWQVPPRTRRWLTVLTAAVALLQNASPAWSVPAFAREMGVACAVCHTVAFGPALTPYGRNFKLHGYALGTQRTIPVSADLVAAFTHTQADLPALPHYSANDNTAINNVDIFLAGRIADHFGGLAQVTYDGLARHTSWSNLDLRYAQDFTPGGVGTLFGVSLNNSPTVQDPWNSTPIWQFPFPPARFSNGSQQPQVHGAFGQTVLGATAYTLIAETLYLEAGGYRALADGAQNDLGISDPELGRKLDGTAPYWRAALQKTSGPHYASLGVLGFAPRARLPSPAAVGTDNYTDTGYDATYQFANGGPHTFNANASYIHESQRLFATSSLLGGVPPDNHLNTWRVDAEYGYRQTYAFTLGYFSADGNANPVLFRPGPFFGSATGSPDSRGYVLQLEYIPFGKAGSPAGPWLNLRLGVQYTLFSRLNGGDTNYDGFGHSASDSNTLFVYVWTAI
ncbi:MAG TPA: hypothetical protein VIE42_03565 [Steroidobacteraceae bacterium]|jgi:hypothetical protein